MSHDVRRRARRKAPSTAPLTRAYTSRQAAQVSGVPFFTIDYWGRTKTLVPSVAQGQGRGKGRQRMYSYGDLIRLRIARELREQHVSLETLRSVIHKLADVTDGLAEAAFVVVGSEVEMARNATELSNILRRPGRHVFGVILDLRELLKTVRERAASLEHV
ncbi:MAG: MerR family transcriptional regulator [Acidobacteriota bacterium]